MRFLRGPARGPEELRLCQFSLSQPKGSPRQVCRKCAVRSGAVRAKVRLFNTASKVLPCGLGCGKLLIRMVSAVGIEPTTY